MNVSSNTHLLRLQPRGVADMLDAAMYVYRRNFLRLALAAAVVVVPLSTLDAITRMVVLAPMLNPERLSQGDPSSVMLAGQGLNLLLTFTGTAIIYTVMTPALMWMVGQRFLERPASLGAAYGAAFRRLPVTGAVAALYLGVMVLMSIYGAIPCVGWVSVLPLIAFVSVNTLTLLGPVAVLEKGSVWTTLRRCWILTKSNFWRAFGLMAALYLFSIAVTSGPSMLAVFIVALLAENLALGTAISAAVGALLTVLYMPIWCAGLTLLYYDTRVRVEAFDLELIAGIESSPETSLPPRIEWLEKSDLKTLVILAGVIAIPFVLAAALFFFMMAFFILVGAAAG